MSAAANDGASSCPVFTYVISVLGAGPHLLFCFSLATDELFFDTCTASKHQQHADWAPIAVLH
jgi:hypothetical protein